MKALLVLLATLLSAFPAVLLVLALAAFPVSATSYFVSTAGSDSNNGTSLATAFATIQKCSNMALGGDTCTMYGSPTSGTGSFAGWTQSDSGSSGSPITFTVHNGDTVNISSVVNVAGVSWITIGDPGGTGSSNGLPNSPTGCGQSATNSAGGYVAPGGLATFNIGGCFNFNNGHGIIGESISGTVTSHLTVSYNTFTSTPNGPAVAVCASTTEGGCGAGPQVNTSSDNLASHNQINWNGANQFNAFEMYGDRLRLEYNDVTGTGDDFADIGGANMVVVRNYFHDINGATSSQNQHIDFVQIIGAGDSPTSTFSLLEENVEKNCANNGGNCHFYLIRNGTSTPDRLLRRRTETLPG